MKAYAYVDGSFNAVTQVYGAGAVIFLEGREEPFRLSQGGNNPIYARSRNVAGEVLAASMVVEICKKVPNLEELTLYYDYAGIECWVKGTWRTNTSLSQNYSRAMQGLPFKLSFRKVKAHTGVQYNEEADALAKKACGL